jgi:hypothetical protein
VQRMLFRNNWRKIQDTLLRISAGGQALSPGGKKCYGHFIWIDIPGSSKESYHKSSDYESTSLN